MASTIQVRVDEELKRKSDQLFKELGTDTTAAIRIFLTQAVANNGFPFEIKRKTVEEKTYTGLSEEEMLAKLNLSREHSAQGRQKEADKVITEMRARYEL